MNVTLKQIRAFRALAELKSFTRSAERLGLTQSALSLLIRELEREVEVRLFDRTTRSVELTAAGRELLPYAAKAMTDLEHGLRSTSELAARRRGRVTVATPPIAAAMLVPRAVVEFHARYPGIAVVVQDLAPEEIVSRVRDGLADCGIGPFANTAWEGLDRTSLADGPLILAMPRGHALAAKRAVVWADLLSFPVIAVASVRRDLDRNLPAGLSLEPTYEVSQMVTAIGMVGAGLGIAVVPAWMTPMTRLYDIVTRPVTGPIVSREVSLVTRSGYPLSPAADSFVAHLYEHFRRLPAIAWAENAAPVPRRGRA
jgi:DNA-binding transcriptional LysR family regulator